MTDKERIEALENKVEQLTLLLRKMAEQFCFQTGQAHAFHAALRVLIAAFPPNSLLNESLENHLAMGEAVSIGEGEPDHFIDGWANAQRVLLEQLNTAKESRQKKKWVSIPGDVWTETAINAAINGIAT